MTDIPPGWSYNPSKRVIGHRATPYDSCVVYIVSGVGGHFRHHDWACHG